MPGQHRGRGPTGFEGLVKAANYSADKKAGNIELKAKGENGVFLHKIFFDKYTGDPLPAIIAVTTIEALENEKEQHKAAIASINEMIKDINAME